MSTFIPTNSTASQSGGLRERHQAMHDDGRTLVDHSVISESNLSAAIPALVEYAKQKLPEATITHINKITLFELQTIFHKTSNADVPTPELANQNVFIKPDGGIILATINNVTYPILISEDKLQGTNDQRLAENKPRQALGNAIERAAKNIRCCEMLCSHIDYFPYALFASGCDFHHSETISKRIEMMNMGHPNHYLEIVPQISPELVDTHLNTITANIDISKKWNGFYSIASAFVKAHKWNQLPHLSSLWKTDEYLRICTEIIDQSIAHIHKKTA